MIKLLKEISELAIELGDFQFTRKQVEDKWLGTERTTENEIKLTQKRLKIEFPSDFKQFLLITNGFSATNTIEPSFMSIDEIDYLKNIDDHVIEAYSIEGIKNIGKQLENSILIGGVNEEQYFLLIPPSSDTKHWKYWKFANWYPGEQEFHTLESYFESVLEFMREEIKSKQNYK